MEEDDFNTVAEHTKGYSASDIVTLVADASMAPVRELSAATVWRCEQTRDGKCRWRPCREDEPNALRGSLHDIPAEDAHARDLCAGDILAALSRNPRTVSEAELDTFAAFNR